MGKCCLHVSSFIFDRTVIKVAGNQDRHKSSDELISGRIRLLTRSYLPLNDENFYTFELEYLWGLLVNLDQILCVASLGVGKGCILFLRLIGSKLWCPWQQKAPLTYTGGNGVSTFFRLLLIQSFLYLQVTRTCMKSPTSSNCGQIGPLTTELAALERLKHFP